MQAVTHLLLEDRLQRVIGHVSVGLRAGDVSTGGTVIARGHCRASDSWQRRGLEKWCRRKFRHALCVVVRHHQVSAALTNVTNLEGRITPELMLNGQVPLVVQSRLGVRIPNANESPSVASISWRGTGCVRPRAHNPVRRASEGQILTAIIGIDFGRGKRRIQGQAQVRARAFQIGGDGEGAPDNSVGAKPTAWSVSESNAGLEGSATIEAVVEGSAGSILVGKVEIAREPYCSWPVGR